MTAQFVGWALPNISACQIQLGDVNDDGQFDFNDINAFIALLGFNLPEPRKFTYDEENRLTNVWTWDLYSVLEIKYDALGRRVETRYYREARTPCGTTVSPLITRHVYGMLDAVAEYIDCGSGAGVPACRTAGVPACQRSTWKLAREFVYGASPAPRRFRARAGARGTTEPVSVPLASALTRRTIR